VKLNLFSPSFPLGDPPAAAAEGDARMESKVPTVLRERVLFSAAAKSHFALAFVASWGMGDNNLALPLGS